MLRPKTASSDGLSISVLLFMFLMKTSEVFLAAQSELICSDQLIVALAGDDVVLPCDLRPPIDASPETVVWIRPGLDPKYIHVHEDGRLGSQHPSYYGRTVLFVDKMENGNVSLKLFRVKLSDAAKYKCILQSLKKEASIELTVGAVSTPVAALADVDRNTGQVVLSCESEGWYPQPEVSWLDAEGHVLPAGPTETVRGPDGLYTVSSRVTVDKRRNNTFTCRVQQRTISQSRETLVHVPAHLFIVQSCSQWIWSFVGLSCFVLLIAVPLFQSKLANSASPSASTKATAGSQATDTNKANASSTPEDTGCFSFDKLVSSSPPLTSSPRVLAPPSEDI